MIYSSANSPLPSDQVELITLALIYKFMDDMDEESVGLGGRRSFFVGDLAPYRWRALLPQTVSADDRVTLFSAGLEAIGNAQTGAHLPELFRDIFRNAFLKFRDGRILTLFLTEVNGFAYSHSEELGNAFEYLLQCMGTQGENGQFRTPRHIIDFIVACLDPQPTDKILDPACGTGGFLVSAYKHILQNNTSPGSTVPGDRLGRDQLTRLYGNLTGYDITDLMVKLSKVNLFLHGFPDPAIHIYDSLSNDARWHEKADLILANPPFMTPKGGVTPHTRFRIPAKKAEVLFTDYIAEHLSPDGRAGIIVPNGIVATTQNAYVKLRRFLVEDSLVAVVSLPSGVFKPYSGVKTSILFLDKKLARRTDDILFLKISADGFDLGDQRREITANDLPEVERILKASFKGTLSGEIQTPVNWGFVSRRDLLNRTNCPFQGELFLNIEQRTSEHRIVKLGEICNVVRGSSPRPQGDPNFFGGPVPRLMIADITRDGMWVTPKIDSLTEEGAKRSRPMKAGDVVMAVSASPGLPALLKVDACIHDGFAGLKDLPKDLDRTFLYYVLLALRTKHDGQADGATFRNITTDQIREFEIPLPPLEEQRGIVTEIEAYQQVIDGARQILTAYRPQIDVGAEWPVVELAGIICGKPKNGYSGKPVAHETNLKVLSLSATTSGRLNATKFKFLDEYIAPDAECRCRRGDIYLQRGNTAELVGTAALFDLNATDYIYPDLMIRVRADETKVLTKFLLHTLQSSLVRAFLTSQAGGAAGNMPKINQSIVQRVPIPLPPLPEQERIVAELDAEAAQIEAVRGLIPAFEAKIQRTLARVWGTAKSSI